MKRPKLELPLRTALLYLVLGGLWILLADQFLFRFVFPDVQETLYRTLAESFFVLVSGILIYALLQSGFAGRRQAEQRAAAALGLGPERRREAARPALGPVAGDRERDAHVRSALPAAGAGMGSASPKWWA